MNEWNKEKTLGSFGQKKSHKEGKRGINMYVYSENDEKRKLTHVIWLG